MDRKKELLGLFTDEEEAKGLIIPLIDDVVFLEARLQELRALPFLRINPENPALQKPTPASKQYKELLQQYNQCIKILAGILRKEDTEEESPLRAYLKSLERSG
jgi:hypothetical protein